MSLRDATAEDLVIVHELNESALPHVNRVDGRQLTWFLAHAEYFRLAGEEGAVRAFLIGLAPGHPYRSPNYQWFQDRYDRFMYIDRIVVSRDARGLGLGRRLYDDLAHRAVSSTAYLCCEVNLRPPNEGSLAFHRRLGFREVGRQETGEGARLVALLVKEIPAA